MTAAVVPIRRRSGPSSPNGEGGRAAGVLGGRFGTTSLRVGVARSGSASSCCCRWPHRVAGRGGGWHAFWLAVTSNAALESFRVTLTISAGVTVINLLLRPAGGLGPHARRLFRQTARRRRDRPAVCAAHDRHEPGDAGLVRPEQPGRHSSAAHQVGCRHRAAVRHAAVRGALGAAGAAGTRSRDRGGGGSLGANNWTIFTTVSCRRCCPRCCPVRVWRSPAPSASSARWC